MPMTDQLNSEQISKHLYIIMFVIIVSVGLISTSMIIDNYQRYKLSQKTLSEIEGLKMAAELAHLISRERAPSNKVMSSNPEELALRKQELIEYRLTVDDYIQKTQTELVSLGFIKVAECVDTQLRPALQRGRAQVDYYANLPPRQRSAEEMNKAIGEMYKAWDSTYIALKHLVKDSQGRESNSSDYYTLILILADLRDQAGRVASNVMPAVTFKQPIAKENLGKTLQTQRQTHYLWEMIDVIQPEDRKTQEFKYLYERVNTQFLQQGLTIVNKLIEESLTSKPYSLTGTELTNAIVDHFVTVIDLQDYLFKQSVKVVSLEKEKAKKQLTFALILAMTSILAILMTLIYAKKWIFNPLIHAREILIGLISKNYEKLNQKFTSNNNKNLSLLSAIQDLQIMLQQRDDLEFQLKNIANTDALSGVSNRLALEEYIKYMHQQPNQFLDTCLIVIDIDYFKAVNDQFGHLIGDEVIKYVSNILKTHVRATDFIVRYGGDEFLILMQHISVTRALALAEDIRTTVYSQRIPVKDYPAGITVSLSIGIASGMNEWAELMQAADKALLDAKARGRNYVQCA